MRTLSIAVVALGIPAYILVAYIRLFCGHGSLALEVWLSLGVAVILLVMGLSAAISALEIDSDPPGLPVLDPVEGGADNERHEATAAPIVEEADDTD